MSEEDAFIAAIRANPADNTIRLVYADWLQEHDRPEARYIRLELQLTKCGPKAQKFAAVFRRGLQELCPQLNPCWLAIFDQPGVLRTNLSPYPAYWSGTHLHQYRSARGTYQGYPYESLPPLPDDLHQSDWGWVFEPSTPRPRAPDWAARVASGLEWITERAQKTGIKLPPVFSSLLNDGAVLGQIRSCTGCYFSPTEGISPCPRQPGAHVIPFFRDSQDCLWWSLFVAPSGYHCVVVSPPFFGDGRSVPKPNPNQTQFCAPSLEAFVYRWWIENEIWFRLLDPQFEYREDRPFTAEMHAYLNHYRPSST